VIAFLDRFDREPFGGWDLLVLAALLAAVLRGGRTRPSC
jgi:hypothetical protein